MNLLHSQKDIDMRKLIVGFSAEAMSQTFLTIADGISHRSEINAQKINNNSPIRQIATYQVNYRRKRETAIDRQIGDRAASYKKVVNRTHDYGIVTQTEVYFIF